MNDPIPKPRLVPTRVGESLSLGAVELSSSALALAEQVGCAFWVVSKDWASLFFVNPAYENVWGCSLQSLAQQPLSFLASIPPEEAAEADQFVERAKAGQVAECHFRIVRPDGNSRWIHLRAFPVCDKHGEFCRIVCLADDQTKQRQSGEQLRQAQQLEGIGQTAGVVAHDITNILAAVLMNVAMLRTRQDLPVDVTEYLGELESEMQRAAGLTRQLLSVSRRPKAGPKPLTQNGPSPEIPGGTETILLVEDEVTFRRTVALWLRKLGYAVIEAGNGPEAVQIWEKERARIRLLITDFVMPAGMTGLALAERLRRDQPALPVIVASGFSTEFSQAQPEVRNAMTFLAKPYPPSALATLVRECLDGESVETRSGQAR